MNVFEELFAIRAELNFKKIFVLRNSLLHKTIDNFKVEYELFDIKNSDKTKIVEYLKDEDFDMLISNGCPFILPITELGKDTSKVLFINTHPSYLPYLKGKTPLNGVFMLDYDFIGATTHFMDSGIDSGNIIYQKKINLTEEIDQGLVYMISFKLESFVFKKAFEILKKNKFCYCGKPQIGTGTYFNRFADTFIINFQLDNSENIKKKVNSLGMTTMFNLINIEDFDYKLHHCEVVVNRFLINLYADKIAGEIVYKYSDKMLIKTLDGLVKVSYI